MSYCTVGRSQPLGDLRYPAHPPLLSRFQPIWLIFLAPPSLVTHRRRHTTLVHEPRALAGLGRAQRNALGAAVSTLFLDYVQQLED